jgi:hypothetical protein
VTVGLSGQTIEVELDKKLKASARVIDSVSGLPLIGYELSVFREPDLAGESEKEITVTVNGLDGEWETDEALPVGSYRIETNLEGYRIRNDQVLDATLNGADRVFRFEIRASLTEKLVLNDIRADPYAKVSGRVFRPTVDSLGVVQFEPIDEPLLKVTMKCTGRSPGASSKEAAATLSDEFIVSGSDRYDTFTFPRETFAEQQLDRANCTINAEAGPTYAAAAPISFSNLSVSNGSAYTDRIVNFALAKPLVNTFKGTTFWIDQRNGQSRPVGGVTLTSLGAGAIVDFKANISGPEQSELVPESSFALLETRGDSTTGVWQFNGPKNQVIGQTLYRVEAPSGEFANGTINVTVNGAGDRTVNAVSGVVVTGSDANGFNIQMLPPNPGTLSGTVKILSVDNNFQKVTVKGYEPTNNPVLVVAPATPTPDETATVSPGTFEFLSASAGTWTVDFTAPPNHEFLVAATSSTDVFVPPNKSLPEPEWRWPLHQLSSERRPGPTRYAASRPPSTTPGRPPSTQPEITTSRSKQPGSTTSRQSWTSRIVRIQRRTSPIPSTCGSTCRPAPRCRSRSRCSRTALSEAASRVSGPPDLQGSTSPRPAAMQFWISRTARQPAARSPPRPSRRRSRPVPTPAHSN